MSEDYLMWKMGKVPKETGPFHMEFQLNFREGRTIKEQQHANICSEDVWYKTDLWGR